MNNNNTAEDFDVLAYRATTNLSISADRILMWDASAGQNAELSVVNPSTLRSAMVIGWAQPGNSQLIATAKMGSGTASSHDLPAG